MKNFLDTFILPHPWKATCLGSLLAAALVIGVLGCKKESAETSTPGQLCIDLSHYYTASLTDSLNSPAQVKENNLASLPKGRQVFSGVPFEVGGVVQLSGKKNLEWGRNEYPEAVKDIKVGKKAKRFHLLHGAGGVYDKDGVTIAQLVLHFADNSVREIDIKSREDATACAQEGTGKNTPDKHVGRLTMPTKKATSAESGRRHAGGEQRFVR